jgi:hypothetical protein
MQRLTLILDDNRLFSELGDRCYARTSEQAINFLREHRRIHEMWFDHDLSGKDTGMIVVDWILRQTPRIYIDRCYVHSMNGYPAEQMVKMLRRKFPHAYRIPLPRSMVIHPEVAKREQEEVERVAKLGHLMVWDHKTFMASMKDKHVHLTNDMYCLNCNAKMTVRMDSTDADPKLSSNCR